jgi:transcriptional regulatory protein GAL4
MNACSRRQGNYVQKRDRPNTGYLLIGLACRIALALGLHRESSDNTRLKSDIPEQLRRRVFWSLFCIEAGFSLTVGRPPAIDYRYITIPPPADTDDTVWPSCAPFLM